MRKILGDGLKAMKQGSDFFAALFVLGPSSKPYAMYAEKVVLEITIGEEQFLVPIENLQQMIDRAKTSIDAESKNGNIPK